MQTIRAVGLDIAKSVFYVLAFFQKLPSCLVGIEACAASHHWSRELLMSPMTRRALRCIAATSVDIGGIADKRAVRGLNCLGANDPDLRSE